MNNETQKTFRNAIGGFNREDVTNYIKESDMKHAERVAELEARIAELENHLSESEEKCGVLEESLDEAKSEQDKLTDELSFERAKNAELEGRLNFVAEETESFKAKHDEEVRELTEKNESAMRSLAEAEERVGELTRLLDEANAKSVEPEYDPNDRSSPAYKLEMYDKISSQLGDILINANRNADDILTAAREEAEKIRLDTDAECEKKRLECEAEIAAVRAETSAEAASIRKRLSGATSSLLEAIKSDMHSNIESCINEMNDCISDMQYDMQSLLSKISVRSDEMNDRLDYYSGCISEGVEKKLTGMDEDLENGNSERS